MAGLDNFDRAVFVWLLHRLQLPAEGGVLKAHLCLQTENDALQRIVEFSKANYIFPVEKSRNFPLGKCRSLCL